VITVDKIIENRNSIAQLIDDNIFHIKYLEGTHSDVEDFKEGFRAYQLLSQGRPVKVIAEMCKNATISSEASKYAQKNKIPAIAEAIVVVSLPQRIVLSFYAKLRDQTHPLKFFKSAEDALIWLKSLD
jgi:hypothetical protein